MKHFTLITATLLFVASLSVSALVANPPAREFRVPGTGTALFAFSPDGTTVITADSEGRLQIWDAVTGQELRRVPQMTPPASYTATMPGGERILTSAEQLNPDRIIRIQQLPPGEAPPQPGAFREWTRYEGFWEHDNQMGRVVFEFTTIDGPILHGVYFDPTWPSARRPFTVSLNPQSGEQPIVGTLEALSDVPHPQGGMTAAQQVLYSSSDRDRISFGFDENNQLRALLYWRGGGNQWQIWINRLERQAWTPTPQQMKPQAQLIQETFRAGARYVGSWQQGTNSGRVVFEFTEVDGPILRGVYYDQQWAAARRPFAVSLTPQPDMMHPIQGTLEALGNIPHPQGGMTASQQVLYNSSDRNRISFGFDENNQLRARLYWSGGGAQWNLWITGLELQ